MSQEIVTEGRRVFKRIEQQVLARSFQASNELRNAALFVLRGQRSGRRYRVPFTRRTYTASAPGEPPAVRTGTLRGSWFPRPRSEIRGNGTVALPGVYSEVPYARFLDPELTDAQPGRKIRPRPFVNPIKQRAWPAIVRIYRRRYT